MHKAVVQTVQREWAEEKQRTREWEKRQWRGVEHDKMVMGSISQVLCHRCQSVVFTY